MLIIGKIHLWEDQRLSLRLSDQVLANQLTGIDFLSPFLAWHAHLSGLLQGWIGIMDEEGSSMCWIHIGNCLILDP